MNISQSCSHRLSGIPRELVWDPCILMHVSVSCPVYLWVCLILLIPFMVHIFVFYFLFCWSLFPIQRHLVPKMMLSWMRCLRMVIHSFFSFKQEQNLSELSLYRTPIIQMTIKYISSFVNHLKKALLLIRPSFLELEEFVRQDIFILLK